MSPTGFEPVTPPLKAECSETNWATKTLVGIPGLEPGWCPLPKSGDLPISPHPVINAEEWGVDPHTFQYQPFSRRCHRPLWLLFHYCCLGWTRTNTLGAKIRCPAFRLRDNLRPICQRTFSFEVSIRFELMTPGYKAGILPTILRDRFFGYKKTRTWFEFGSYIPFIFLVNLYQLINENALICERSVL